MSNPKREIRVVLYPGSDHSGAIAVPRHHKRVIDGDPVLDVIPERLEAEIGVVSENLHKLRVAPPAEGLLEVVGQVPVIERDHRLDADLLQPPNERPVVVGADFVITPAGAVGEYPGPGQGEPVVADPELLDGSDVGGDVVVTVAAHVPGGDPVPTARKSVPNGEPLPVLIKRALNLIRRRAHRPDEVFGERLIEESLVAGIGQFGKTPPRFQTCVWFCSSRGEGEKCQQEWTSHTGLGCPVCDCRLHLTMLGGFQGLNSGLWRAGSQL